MSEQKPTPLMSLIHSVNKSEREILIEVANEIRLVQATATTAIRQGVSLGKALGAIQHDVSELKGELSDIKGHLLRVDSTTRQVSSNDLAQEARIAELETGWRKVLHVVGSTLASDRAKSLADWGFRALVAYLAAKGFKVLP